MPIGLTHNQRDAARVIAEFLDDTGRPPSLRELASELEVSRTGAHFLVGELERRGWLRRNAGKIELLHRPPPAEDPGELELTAAGFAAARRAS